MSRQACQAVALSATLALLAAGPPARAAGDEEPAPDGVAAAGASGDAEPEHHAPEMSPAAREVPHDPAVFRPDPHYPDRPHDGTAQLAIYGGKHRNPTQRPLLELGRELYAGGPFRRPQTALGEKNLVAQALLLYGDVRVGAARADDGTGEDSVRAARLNLDLDWQITGTERMHAFVGPFEQDGRFLGTGNSDLGEALDANLDALFFEGELGAIASGVRGRDSRFDLPFAVGLMPLLFQNGVWVEDAFTGLAVTLPARNSAALGISNMDLTFFAGLDQVDSGAVVGESAVDIYGVTAFVEAHDGYWELGYGYTDDRAGDGAASYHNVALAFTRRYGAAFSNSVRVIGNLGQDEPSAGVSTAEGAIVLVESSFITSRPYTVVPYLNLFGGFDQPQSLARDPLAGGILKNTGLLFESDGLTRYPTLDATGHNTYGGAGGIELLFGFKRQLVIEVAVLDVRGPAAERTAAGGQAGLGLRFQTPLSHALILRADAMAARRDNEEDAWGARVEFRYKF